MLIRLDREGEYVRLEHIAGPSEETQREALELYADLRYAPRHPLARPDVEGHARPAQVVDEEPPAKNVGVVEAGDTDASLL